jgi:hypothetical protein
VLVGIGGEVNSLFIGVALLVNRGLGFFCMRVVRQNQRNLYESGLSHSRVVACDSNIHLAEL